MDKHIVWSGELYHKTGETVTADSLRWAVLMRESVLGPKRLELYHTHTDYASSLPVMFVLNLGDMLHVERELDPAPPSKTPLPVHSSPRCSWDVKGHDLSSSIEPPARHQFTISTEKDVHVFSTRSSSESSLWVGKLNELLHGPPEQGVEYEFPVQVFSTPFSRSLALQDSHALKVSEVDVRLYDASGTTPTSFVCPLGSIERVDHTAPRGASPGLLSLHCSNDCGTAGGRTITLSTPSTADISRILNHRRMAAAPLHTPPPPTPTTAHTTAIYSSITNHYASTPSQRHCLTPPQNHHPSTSRTLSSPSPTSSPTCGQFQRSQSTSVKPRPPATVIGLSKQKGAEELISSSSDSDENDDGYVHVTAGQIERFRSQRRKSGGDFESVASWVHHKKDSLLQGGREGDGFGRVNSFPNISDQSRSQGLSSQESNRLSDEGATGVHVTSMSVRRQSTKRKFAQSRHQLIRRSSSLGSSLDEDQVYTSVKTIASEAGKGKGDAPGSHGSLISNDMYGGSWQSPTSAANGNGDLDGEQQATDSLLHHYESVKELGLTRQSASIDSNPDYDYVKDRILGVRGLPVRQPATSYSSDEEENYYY